MSAKHIRLRVAHFVDRKNVLNRQQLVQYWIIRPRKHDHQQADEQAVKRLLDKQLSSSFVTQQTHVLRNLELVCSGMWW